MPNGNTLIGRVASERLSSPSVNSATKARVGIADSGTRTTPALTTTPTLVVNELTASVMTTS